jgi:hypothetical protein
MEGYCSTGQSPQRAVAPTEEEEGSVDVVRFVVVEFLDAISSFLTTDSCLKNCATFGLMY